MVSWNLCLMLEHELLLAAPRRGWRSAVVMVSSQQDVDQVLVEEGLGLGRTTAGVVAEHRDDRPS